MTEICLNRITKYYSENINTARIRIHLVLDRYQFLFLPPLTYRRSRLRARFATPDTSRREEKNRRRNHRSLAQSACEFASRSRVIHSRSSIIATRSPPRRGKDPTLSVNSTAYNHRRRTYDCFRVCSETTGRPSSFESRESGDKYDVATQIRQNRKILGAKMKNRLEEMGIALEGRRRESRDSSSIDCKDVLWLHYTFSLSSFLDQLRCRFSSQKSFT